MENFSNLKDNNSKILNNKEIVVNSNDLSINNSLSTPLKNVYSKKK